MYKRQHPESSDWIVREPVVFDEDHGIAIFGIDAAGTVWLGQNAERLADFGVDANAVRAFAKVAGPVFAVDTF